MLVRNRISTFGLLVAAAASSACSSSDSQSASPSPSAGTAAAALSHPAPPAGTYRLTDDIPIVISSAAVAGGGREAAGTFRIGDHDAHEIIADADGGWLVPGLDLELETGEAGGAATVRVRRYGETVVLRQGERNDSDRYEALSTVEVLRDLTPRLMIGLNVPGAAIALIKDGEISWRGHFGVKRSGEAARVDSTTLFEAASMSKPAYTYPFMKLVEDGTISLDTPLVEYLGHDYIADDTLHRQITARMVLSHTTGFPNWRRDTGLAVRFRPGTEIGYSGEGFQFLQTVTEKLTGQSTDLFAEQRLLQPLDMSTASYVWRDAYDSMAASGHTREGSPRPRKPYLEPNSAYTLYTTPGDYAAILVEIMKADRAAPHSLSEATRDLMLASQHTAPDRSPIRRGGAVDGEVHYALGWRMDRSDGRDRYWHSGSNSTGFQCYAEFEPSTGDGIVIMTNSSSGSPLWRSLRDTIGEL